MVSQIYFDETSQLDTYLKWKTNIFSIQRNELGIRLTKFILSHKTVWRKFFLFFI